ncbi:hypothetical protein BV25DRAFT_1813909 [Artomyces pyxidatus]|uniref:Uncharacterized protein n=1 Tax=Artomyces pyxidatus TaxID=48021 RepID=A0ACB8SJV0_9AGAM|nr:hypothetical protein BV25DRAFT_1813909 [Artomyces pyxidatus]
MESTVYVILDSKERIIGALVPPPIEGDARSPEARWEAAMERLGWKFEDLRVRGEERGAFASAAPAARGDFTAVSFGVSYGGGQVVSGVPLAAPPRSDHGHTQVPGELSQALASFFPKPYDHMKRNMDALYDRHRHLRRNFNNSEYPTAAANLGPRTVCHQHNDCSNYPGLACAITALGDFDFRRGGHMCLWDLKLKIQFPPGCTILLSSAGMRHGNAPIAPGERRYSFTQYCPGGLLRWVRYGFRRAKTLSKAKRAQLDRREGEGWAGQLARLSKYAELQADRRWLLEQDVARAESVLQRT